MNKVMVLGAGRGQVPMMELCKQYGCYVVAISPQGDYPGMLVADKVINADVREKETILNIARKEKIKAIVTDQLDAGVQTGAYVAEAMGLKGITYEVALKFTNKYLMRKEAEKIGVNVPASVSIKNIEKIEEILKSSTELEFPLMMKPVDSAASKGVYKVNNIKEILEKFEISRKYSKDGEVILERYIEGKEYVVEAFTRDYITTNLIVGHRDYFQVPETFIPNATVFIDANSANSELETRLKEINKNLVEGFGLNFGITHGEYMYNEVEDKIYLVEIAARGGGVFISSDLIPAASGINANDLLVKEVLGISDNSEIKIKKGASAYFCYLLPEGTVTLLNGIEQIENIDGVLKPFFDNIEVGTISKCITDKSSRKGPILVYGDEKEDCYKVIEEVKNVLEIKVVNNNQEYDVIWHDV